jgi:hypothetical protein
MARKTKQTVDAAEDKKLREFEDDIAPRMPWVKIYRIEKDGRQTFLGATDLEFFSFEMLRHEFGGGKFLVRTVRSNGTWGPSRIVHVASDRDR